MDLLDREDIKPHLRDAFTNLDGCKIKGIDADVLSRSVIVYSKPGIGKTALISTLLEEANFEPINVGTRGGLRNALNPPGHYFQEILTAFKKRYRDFQPIPHTRLTPKFSFSLPILFGVNISLQPDEHRENEGLRAKASAFIDYCGKRRIRPVFHLEHCENIDQDSLELIFLCARQIPGSLYVFEYSLREGVSSEDSVSSLESGIQGSLRLNGTFPLHQLDFKDAVGVVGRKVDISRISLSKLSELYKKAEGNINRFSIYCQDEARGSGFGDPAALTISNNTLDFVYTLIALCRDGISFSKLVGMIDSYPCGIVDEREVKSACRILEKQHSIEGCNADLIRPVPSNAQVPIPSSHAAYTAYGVYGEFISSEIERNASLENYYALLDAQYSFLDPALIDTIERIRPDLCAAAPSKAFLDRSIDLLNRLEHRRDANPSFRKRASLTFFSVLYDSGNFKGASALIDSVSDEEISTLCRFLLDCIDLSSRNMASRMKALERRYGDDMSLLLFIRASYLGYMMRTSDNEDVQSYISQTLMDEGLKSHPEYWWFVKQRSYSLPSVEAVQSLREAFAKCEELSAYQMAARCEITLATKLALSGSPDEAARILQDSRASRRSLCCKTAYYLNNIAACHYLMGEANVEDIRLLDMAASYSLTSFEMTFVYANSLVISILLGEEVQAHSLVRRLAKCKDSVYAGVGHRRILYTSLLLYALWTNDKDLASQSRSKIHHLVEKEEDDSKRHRLEKQLTIRPDDFTDARELIRAFDYCPGFIGYWQPPFERGYIKQLLER